MFYGRAIHLFFLTCAFSLMCFSFITAQEKKEWLSKVEIVNEMALSLPEPKYPSNVPRDVVDTTIKVLVWIDVEGNVISAKAMSGHPILQVSAEQAAKCAKFFKPHINGISFPISGIVVYDLKRPLSNKSFMRQTQSKNSKTNSEYCADNWLSGYVLNGRAINLIKPKRPKNIDNKISGAVTVQVSIDENGDVVSAAAISGHPSLREVSFEAVKQSKFKRLVCCGKSAKYIGTIIYNFERQN